MAGQMLFLYNQMPSVGRRNPLNATARQFKILPFPQSREVREIEDSLEALTLKNKGQIQSIHPIMLTFPLPFPLGFSWEGLTWAKHPTL